MSNEPKTPGSPGSASAADPTAINCPTCGGVVDPRRTTQAISRGGRLLLFCTSGCLRTFLAEERAKADAPKA